MIRRSLLVAVLLAGVIFVGWFLRRGKNEELADPVNVDPRATYDTPFLNVRPEVQYVGSKVCAGCHLDQAKRYALHPMGRAFAALAETSDKQVRYDQAAHNPFEKFGNIYSVDHQDRRTIHRVRRPGAGSEACFELAHEIAFVMGSGSHGRSYIINRDGRLYQSPISWFTQQMAWDVSPGYNSEMFFDRPIHVQCLYCHCNHAQPMAHSINHFHLPLASEYPIGCERCHGPGELHVRPDKRPGRPEGTPDYTIVDPKRLEPGLRDAVCEQCHLQGEARIVRRGREVFDYRPGMPLHLFWSVFVRLPELRDAKAVGQVEQMQASKCWSSSKGRLGCISCHDPHYLPPHQEKAGFYRQRCQKCHGNPGQTACSAPPADRELKGNACHTCHMPRLHTADIAHTAMSDHRVLRNPPAEEPPNTKRPLLPGEVPLVWFHRNLGAPDDNETRRDLGMALSEIAERNQRVAEPLSLLALPLLDKAVEETPHDVPTREARGYARWFQGRAAKALEDFEAVLARAPERERSLVPAAYITMTLDKLDLSADYWRRIIAVNPWEAQDYADYARVLMRSRDWAKAIDACRAGLRINPGSIRARMLLVEALLRSGERAKARTEFEALLAASPPQDHEEIRRWHEGLNR